MSLEILFILLLGLAIGSFLNVVIHRVPKGESIVFPSSYCPKCGVKLRLWHNIPVLSWLFLQGRCKFCNSKISVRYPIVESLTGVIFVILYLKLGFTSQFLVMVSLFSTLLALAVIDLEYRAVPDSLNLLALTLAIIHPLDLNLIFETLQHSLIFGGAFSFLRFYVSFFVGKEAMGEGDIMVAGTIGAILGIWTGTFAIFLSSVLAIPVILLTKQREMPFIPFLALSLFIVYLFEKEVISFLNYLLY